MKSSWGWTPERTYGIWRHGAGWLKPLVAAVPFLTVAMLLVMIYIASGAITMSQGVLFDLPDEGVADVGSSQLVALVMPMKSETLLFFDDSRYVLGELSSMRSFERHLKERVQRVKAKTLLVLADRRVSGGDLMTLAAIAKRGEVRQVLFAEKKAGTEE